MAEQFLLTRWNRDVPVGTEVEVMRDSGAIDRRKTECGAWLAAGPVAVVKLEGIPGSYRLSRCWAPGRR